MTIFGIHWLGVVSLETNSYPNLQKGFLTPQLQQCQSWIKSYWPFKKTFVANCIICIKSHIIYFFFHYPLLITSLKNAFASNFPLLYKSIISCLVAHLTSITSSSWILTFSIGVLSTITQTSKMSGQPL